MRFLRKLALLLFGSVAVLLIRLLVADKVFGLNKGRTFDPMQVLLALFSWPDFCWRGVVFEFIAPQPSGRPKSGIRLRSA